MGISFVSLIIQTFTIISNEIKLQKKVTDVELYSRYQCWPVNPPRQSHITTYPFRENWGIPLTLSIATTAQAEQGNHDFPVDISSRRHNEPYELSSLFSQYQIV